MKKGFTLLEVMVVIVIIGVLATLSFVQYASMVERSRGAEARVSLGNIRAFAAAWYFQYSTLNGMPLTGVHVSSQINDMPVGCRETHYFQYTVSTTASTIRGIASRCTGTSKPPSGPAGTLELWTDLVTGEDIAYGTGDY